MCLTKEQLEKAKQRKENYSKFENKIHKVYKEHEKINSEAGYNVFHNNIYQNFEASIKLGKNWVPLLIGEYDLVNHKTGRGADVKVNSNGRFKIDKIILDNDYKHSLKKYCYNTSERCKYIVIYNKPNDLNVIQLTKKRAQFLHKKIKEHRNSNKKYHSVDIKINDFINAGK